MASHCARRKICFLTTTRGLLPLPSIKTFFPHNADISYLLSKANSSKCLQLSRNHTHFLPNWTANARLCTCVHVVICPCYGEGGRSPKKSIPKKQMSINTDWNISALHFVNSILMNVCSTVVTSCLKLKVASMSYMCIVCSHRMKHSDIKLKGA